MSNNALRAALLVLLLIVSSLPSSSAAAQGPAATPLTPDLIGMVARDPWYEVTLQPDGSFAPNRAAQERMAQVLVEAGVRWVRMEFIVRAGGGSWQDQIARHDYFINEVAPRYNLKIMGLLGFALVDIDPRDPQNGLVAGQTVSSPYGGGVNQWMKDWLERALFVAKRYEGKIAAFEVLNEQNRLPVVPRTGSHPGYAGGEGIAPALAARLHTKFYRCFKQRQCEFSPSDARWPALVPVVLGGLHPRGSDSIVPKPPAGQAQRLSDREYLAAHYTAAPFVDYFTTFGAYPVDGLGYHPYPAEIRASLAQIDTEVALVGERLDGLRATLRETLKATAPTAAELPFWITEIGYNAGYLRQSEAGQAAFLRAIFTSLGARGDVATIFWFKYEDFPPATGPNVQRWGIVQVPFTEDARCPGGACYDPAGEPVKRRLAYYTLRELAGLPSARVALPLLRR